MRAELLDIEAAPVAALAAAARVGYPLPEAAATRLRRLEPDGLDVTVAYAHGQTVLSVADDIAAHPMSNAPPPLLTTPKRCKALVAALAACHDGTGLVYPGRSATIDDVVALTRPASAHAARHTRGALDDLAALGLLDVESGRVRPGPQLAAWGARRHVEDLPELLDRLISEEVS